jgi:AcrR family transcriptional regulator
MDSPLASPLPRSQRNDAAVHQAITNTLCDLGWAGFTLRNVALHAKVARQTVTDRHPTRTHMATHAWRTTLGPALHHAIQTLLDHHPNHTPDPISTADAWRSFSQPTRELRGALELLLQSPFEPQLSTTIHATLGPNTTHWTTHTNRPTTRQTATQRAYLIARALGLLAMGSINDLTKVDFTPTERAIARALQTPARASRIPLNPPPPVSIETGHPRHNALIQATIEHVAEHGYEAASLDAICKNANVTKGLLFDRYPTKQALFIDAARRRQQAAIASSTTWLEELTTRQSRPRAEATFIRAVLHPNRRTDQRISSEELRLAIHASDLAHNFHKTTEQIAQATLGHIDPITLGYAHSVRAIGEGIGLLTLIEPNAWQLPFEIVLVPLQATLSDAYLGEARD